MASAEEFAANRLLTSGDSYKVERDALREADDEKSELADNITNGNDDVAETTTGFHLQPGDLVALRK